MKGGKRLSEEERFRLRQLLFTVARELDGDEKNVAISEALAILERDDEPETGRRMMMRKRAEAVIRHYPIPPDDDTATVWKGGVMDSRLLADEVLAYLKARDDEPEFCTCGLATKHWTKIGSGVFTCMDCGKPVEEE